jgi:hypothetical protein
VLEIERPQAEDFRKAGCVIRPRLPPSLGNAWFLAGLLALI